MKKYSEHLDGPRHFSGEEAEALFLFEDFICDLAAQISTEKRGIKCSLCAHAGDCTPSDEPLFCRDGIKHFLFGKATLYRKELQSSCKSYFDFLDKIHGDNQYDLHTAEDALKMEFPYLASHPAYAKYAMAAWMIHNWG